MWLAAVRSCFWVAACAAILTITGPTFAVGAELPPAGTEPDYACADPELKTILLDTHATESFLSVRADTTGRLFVGGRESLFVYEPDEHGGYRPRRQLVKLPEHSWVYDIELRGGDLYVLTLSALYVIPGGVTQRENLQMKRLVWGVPHAHVHQCFHALAWGPEGDLYISMGDPLWYYGDFERPDHWGYWNFHVQPEGTKVPYHGVGGIFRCRPDGSNFQVVSRGLRNPCGMAFDRHWNLFSHDNDHESLPAMYVPGRLLHVTPHSYFSWPRGWMQFKTPERADLLETMYNGLGRAVPVGQSYYHDVFLPEKYRDNLLLARWCTRSVTRYPLQTRGASFKTTEQPLLVGQNMTRPVGIAVGRGGRIFTTIAYMSQNEGSPVYRSDLVMITRSDDPATHPFDAYDCPAAETRRLWTELSDPSWSRRNYAHQEIVRRGGALLDEAGVRLAQCAPGDPARHSLIWLAAKSDRARQHVAALLQDSDPLIRSQALRALTEFADLKADRFDLTTAIADADPSVRHAAILACFRSDVEFTANVQAAIAKGPARDTDTYLRQAATLLLAERATLDQLATLLESDDARSRLAGILAVGFRLTVPAATQLLPDSLPLANWGTGEQAFIIDYADSRLDLRDFGRLGTYTVAEHWKAAPHTAEQEHLFALLERRLNDNDEINRLQAAFFLSLLADARSEPRVSEVRAASFHRKLTAAPLKSIDKLWVVGPFADGDRGMAAIHAPEQGALDLTQSYESGKSRIEWTELTSSDGFDLRAKFGPCDRSSFYALVRLETAGPERIQLHIGSDDGIRVWQNGKEVWLFDFVRNAKPSQDQLVLDLQPGSNDLLFRVRNVADACGLHLHYRSLGKVVASLPEKVRYESLSERLKLAGQQNGAKIGKEFLEVDWSAAIRQGDAKRGRQLFGTLACNKCHGITSDAAVIGGPSLAEARKRFTVPYLVESMLTPSAQISPVFKATTIETTGGLVLTGLIVKETADQIEILLPDTTRKTISLKDVETRKNTDQSPMPAGIVRTPDELRDLLVYLLSDTPD